MKVLHVLNELRPSGAETMLRSAAPLWKQHGVQCEILATGASEGEFADTLRSSGYEVHHLPRRYSPAYFLDFHRFVRTRGYSLVHQHAEGASYWLALTALAGGARLVRTMHANFQFEGNLRWRRALQRKHLKALGARFVAIAPGVQTNERERFGVTSDLIWNWIDTSRFQPPNPDERLAARSRWGFNDQDVVIVSVGNCAPVKNHGIVIEVMARTSASDRIRYLHVGLEDECRSERQLAEQLGVADRIVFCGWLANAREALAAADLYVMPSLREGLGVSALEALAVGLPALLAEVSGLKDLACVFPGLLYAAPEPEAFSKMVQAFCALSRSQRTQLGSSYPALAREKFGVDRGVREYCEIYRLAHEKSH